MRHRMNLSVSLAAFAVLASGACAVGATDKMEYGLRLQQGDKYFLKNVNEQQIVQSIMDQPQTMEQTMGFGVDMEVRAVDAQGNMDVTQTYSWVKLRQKNAMGEIVYDSAGPGGQVPAQAQPFVALLGESMTLKLTPKGRVLEVGGLEQMREGLKKKLPAGAPGEQMLMALQRYLSEVAVKESTEGSMAMYPGEAVGVGDSWERKVALSQGFAAIIASRYTVKDRKDGNATLALAATIRPNPDAKPMEIGPTKLTYKLSGKQAGTVSLDESTGLTLNGKLQQELTGQITAVTTMGEQSQEMVIPITIKGTVATETTRR